MKRTSYTVTAARIGAMVLTTLLAATTAGAQLNLNWFTVDAGGHTFSTGAGYRLGGTCGQPDAGTVTGSTYTLAGGFWYGGGGR